jgi:two-component system chemotaxis response regulator CheB
VLLVDDSVTIRAHLAAILEDAPGLEIVGQARDGEEGLREALRLKPDVVVLDLQMPRMDGFTFLRLLMPRLPTPVVVVSSLKQRSDVFRALELGALDFVAKPTGAAASLEGFREEILEKCASVRALRMDNLAAQRPLPVTPAPPAEPLRVVAVGASTGGPQALQQLLAALPSDAPLALVIAQHMPERFTATFAGRLARTTTWDAREAVDGDRLAAGLALIAPGGKHLEVVRDEDGDLRARVLPRQDAVYRYTPSIDRLLSSAAAAHGRRVCGVILTGMGQDGREGIQAVKRAGGLTLAEAEDSAVIYGMPQVAVATGKVDEVLDLRSVATRLLRFARET